VTTQVARAAQARPTPAATTFEVLEAQRRAPVVLHTAMLVSLGVAQLAWLSALGYALWHVAP